MDRIDVRADGTMALVNGELDRSERSLIHLRRAGAGEPTTTERSCTDR